MKRFLTFICLILALHSFAQENFPAIEHVVQEPGSNRIKWEESSWENTLNLFYEPGYITAAGGIGNIEPLLFEGNIIPYYTISLNSLKRWAIVLSPQVILRMYNEYSFPVKTPSYKPRILIIHQTSNTRIYKDWFQYVSWFHHSNGQSGDFYLPDSCTINTNSGSFSTNWVEAGVFASRKNSTHQYYAKIYGQYCYLQDTMLNGIYGRWRTNFDIKFQWDVAKTFGNILDISYLRSKSFVVSNSLKVGVISGHINDYMQLDKRRFIVDYKLSIRPGFLKDVTFFMQYYYGEDYYNIYFDRILNVFRIGITAHSQFFYRE